MISNTTELEVDRRNTAAFIDADPTVLVLTPRIQQKTTTGGFQWVDQPPRDPQRFKIIESNSRARTDVRVIGGTQHQVEFTLLGNWNAVIGAHDIFEYRGSEWEVLSLEYFNGYEQRAAVIRYGRQS